MKGIILYCRKYRLSEPLMANLKARCKAAGTVYCFGECPCSGRRYPGKFW